jgi:hypothetical protein
MVRSYYKTAARWHSYVIDFTVGWSLGEQQATTLPNTQRKPKQSTGLYSPGPTNWRRKSSATVARKRRQNSSGAACTGQNNDLRYANRVYLSGRTNRDLGVWSEGTQDQTLLKGN